MAANNHPDALRFQAHALKLSTAYVGVEELASLASALELMGARGETNGANVIQQRAVSTFAAVNSELDAERIDAS